MARDPASYPAIAADAPEPGRLLTTAAAVAELRRAGAVKRRRKSGDSGGADAQKQYQRDYQENLEGELAHRLLAAVRAEDPFQEYLLRFWSNHFAVSADKGKLGWLMGPYEREALRPRLQGRFADLVLAAVTHPAMLVYLDNVQSVGPRSPQGQRKKRGLNENLARELLELHTMGVRSGYTQQDIVELAKVLSGWTIHRAGDGWTSGFDATAHEPGGKRILGRDYADAGAGELPRVVGDLARQPATARFVAGKLARHFLADDPPDAAVQRLEAAWTRSGGELAAVHEELRRALADRQRASLKLKLPEELVIDALRALPQLRVNSRMAHGAARDMGQAVWSPGSPAGWSARSADWLGPDAMWKRLEWATQWGDRLRGEVDVRAVAERLYGARLGEETSRQLALADSPQQAVALFLASPEFQRR